MRYSIIVPVYKVEKYLRRCIDSILKQTIQDFELILIDDGSPDKSGEICDEYAEKDSRIVVIHQKNAGVSAARNAGIDMAKGEYIVFVDSDDEIRERYLECMDASDADLVVSGVENIGPDGITQHKLQYCNSKFYRIEQELVEEMIKNKSFNFIYSKRYRNDILKEKEIRFLLDISLSEDTIMVAEYLCECDTLEYINAVEYLYYKYSTITLSSFNSQFVMRMQRANSIILSKLKNNWPNLEEAKGWQERCWGVYYYSIFYILREWRVSAVKKMKLLQAIFNMKEYRLLQKEIDYFMADDSKVIRNILKTNNSVIVYVAWKLLKFKERIKK